MGGALREPGGLTLGPPRRSSMDPRSERVSGTAQPPHHPPRGLRSLRLRREPVDDDAAPSLAARAAAARARRDPARGGRLGAVQPRRALPALLGPAHERLDVRARGRAGRRAARDRGARRVEPVRELHAQRRGEPRRLPARRRRARRRGLPLPRARARRRGALEAALGARARPRSASTRRGARRGARGCSSRTARRSASSARRSRTCSRRRRRR